MEKALAVEGGAYAGVRFGQWVGPMLSTHRAGTGGGRGFVGVGLRLNRKEEAQVCLLPLVSEGRGPHLGAQQASWARVGGANALLSCSSRPGGPLPPASPDLPGLAPMSRGPTQPGVGFGGQGISLGA